MKLTMMGGMIGVGMAVMAALSAAEPVAAKVDGIPIYERTLAFPLPEGSFAYVRKNMRDVRLERAIRRLALGSLLNRYKITISSAELDAKWAEEEKVPPSPGCACCSYPSLQAYLQAHYFTPSEYRRDLSLQLGLEKYINNLWTAAYPTQAKERQLVEKERSRLQREYVKVSHLFFNVVQKPEFRTDPDGVRRAARDKAEKAWRCLRRGEPFEQVAREVSEDVRSKNNGGLLGCAPPYTFPFGNDFVATLQKLKTGEYSRPQDGTWGVHIIRRDALSDRDLHDILKETFLDEKWEQEQARALRDARIERFP